jgi:endonuclease III
VTPSGATDASEFHRVDDGNETNAISRAAAHPHVQATNSSATSGSSDAVVTGLPRGQGADDWTALERDSAAWQENVRWLDELLESEYRSPTLGNLADPTDELFYILLTKKTHPRVYTVIYEKLASAFRPWEKLLASDPEQVAAILRPLGMSRVRATQICSIAEKLNSDFGEVSLKSLRWLPCPQARAYLLTLPGVGEKSARCVLMYSLGHDISPMDTHATRVLARFGLLPPRASPRDGHAVLDDRLPLGMARRLHVNLVAHGRAVCGAKQANCSVCPATRRCWTAAHPRPVP